MIQNVLFEYPKNHLKIITHVIMLSHRCSALRRDLRWGEHRAAEIRGGQLCPTESAARRAEGAAPVMDGWSWKIRKFQGTTMSRISKSSNH